MTTVLSTDSKVRASLCLSIWDWKGLSSKALRKLSVKMPSNEMPSKEAKTPFANKIIILIFKVWNVHIIIPAISFKIMVVPHTVFKEIYSTFSSVIDNKKKKNTSSSCWLGSVDEQVGLPWRCDWWKLRFIHNCVGESEKVLLVPVSTKGITVDPENWIEHSEQDSYIIQWFYSLLLTRYN